MTSSRKDLPVSAAGRNVVGIDVGKKRHAAAGLKTDGQVVRPRLSFDNDRAGIDRLEETLLKPLGGPKGVLVAMEATGHYWMPLYFELARRGYESIVINPIQTNAKFRARIRRAKTDKLDAVTIARLALSGEARAARVPDERTLELRLLTRHRWRLVDTAGDLQRFALTLIDRVFPEYVGLFSEPLRPTGRKLIREIGLAPGAILEASERVGPVLHAGSRGRIDPEKAGELLERAGRSIGIGKAEGVMVEQLRSCLELIEFIEGQTGLLDKELERRVSELGSPLPSLGVRAPIAATIHAESDPISDFRHPSQYAAFAGLDPSVFQTGQFTGTQAHISKRGSPHLRKALYMAAMGLYRRHTDLHRCYKKNRRKGRHHTYALVNVTHKLARIVWRMLTDNRPFRARPPSRARRA
jgi:transposase